MKAQQPIHRKDLTRSIVACHRIEDAIWRKLTAMGCDERSSTTVIHAALVDVRRDCPTWCEQEAWGRIADSFATWAATFDSLQLFWRLRRKRDE